MSKESKGTEGTKKSLLDEMLERQGITRIDPPKDFCRIVFPVNPKPVTDKKEE